MPTSTRKQRIVPDAATQAPPVGLVTSTLIVLAGAGVTLPNPLNTIVDWSADTWAFVEPSLADLLSMVEGQSVAVVTQPTVQLEAVPNMNWTFWLRLTASARANCSPSMMEPAAFFI
jgi:hypothetical protein